MSSAQMDEDYDELDVLASLLDQDEDELADIDGSKEEAHTDGLTDEARVNEEEEKIMKELKAAEESMAKLKAKLAACSNKQSLTEPPPKRQAFQPSAAPASGRTTGVLDKPIEEFNKVVSRPLVGAEKEKLLATLAQRKAEALVRQDLADSDDDESLNSYGADIQRKLNHHQDYDKPSSSTSYGSFIGASQSIPKTFTFQGPSVSKPNEKTSYIEPNSRIKISRPTLPENVLKERMATRKFISLTSVCRRTAVPSEQEWVTVGVLTAKTTKTSAKGQTYSLWTLVDLEQSVEQRVSVLLFGSTHTTHWKTMVSSVIGMLNPNLLEPKPGQSNTMLSVNNPEQLLVLGVAHDLGTCKGVRKSGEKCTVSVNSAKCPYCVYHVKNEYRKSASGRPEVQSSFSGTGTSNGSGLDRLKQKVLGKEGVMYGGKLFTPPPASAVKVNTKHHQKDRQRLDTLSLSESATFLLEQEKKAAADAQAQALLKAASLTGRHYNEGERMALDQLMLTKASTSMVELICAPTAGSRNLLKHLAQPSLPASSSPSSIVPKKLDIKSVTPKELLKQHKISAEKQKLERLQKCRTFSAPNLGTKSAPNLGIEAKLSPDGIPSLGRGLRQGQEVELDYELDLTMAKNGKLRGRDAAKAAALRLVREKGVITAANPNDPLIKNRNPLQQQQLVNKLKSQELNSAQNAANLEESSTRSGQKRKIDDVDKWTDIINAKSSHSALIDEDERQKEERYFDQKEKAEQVETKMLNTFEIATTVVSCLQCKYTSTSASQLCYEKGHTLKRSKGTKRFFQCQSCKYRCATVARLPKGPCPKCNNTAWHKSGMISERKGPKLPSEQLSLTGDEINHLNSVGQGKVYLNL